MLDFLKEVGVPDILDLLFMWLVIYTLLVWSKRTRAASVLKGISIVAVVYLIARQFNMVMAAGLLEKFFAIILIALVVIFQEELRYFFEKIASWSLNPRLKKQRAVSMGREEVGDLVRALADFMKEKIGALIVIRGKDLIVRHLDGGIDLNGKISEPLLKSLFDPHSIGHDGAVYVEGNQIIQFSCHLPLSKDVKKLGKGGTRHAAALGLSELCDAMCLVVSEERGTLSVARRGEIREIKDPDQLRQLLEKFYDEIHPKQKENPWDGFLRKNFKEKIVGFALAGTLWFVLVYGAKQTYRTFIVPVTHYELSTPWHITSIEPNKIYVTLGGPRNAFYFLRSTKIKYFINPEAKKGDQKIKVNPSDFEFPKKLKFEVSVPKEVKVTVAERESGAVPSQEPSSASVFGTLRKILPISFGFGDGQGQPEAPKKSPVNQNTDNAAGLKEKVEVVQNLEDVKPEEVIKLIAEKTENGKEPK